MRKLFGTVSAVVLGCGLSFMAPMASASVVGQLQLDGGSATVTNTTLTWNGNATVNTSGGTLDYDCTSPYSPPCGTAVANNTTVTLSNLPPAGGLPENFFMTFSGISALDFTLTAIGPGSTNTDCSAAGLAAHGGACSVAAGEPIILQQGATGTVASLGVSGTATDGTATPIATWLGAFSQTIVALTGDSGVITPAEVQAYFLAGGNPALTETYQGTFSATVSAVPEPSTIGMMVLGGGLVLAGLRRRKTSR